MSWGDAFGRTLGALFALLAIYIIGGFIVIFGFIMIFEDFNYGDPGGQTFAGAIIALIGLIIIALGQLAVILKTLTDAVTDHVTARISRQLGSSRP